MADLKELTRNSVELFNQHRIEDWIRDFADDAELVTPLTGSIKGRDAIKAYFAQMYESYPDIKVTAQRILTEANIVVMEDTVTATNTGPLRLPTGDVLPPTNRKIEVPAVDVATNDASGKVTSVRQYWDAAAALQQLGLMPAPAAARA